MLLKSIEDNRSTLQRATRWELYQFAQENGVKEIVHDMPATLMRKILIAKRITNIRIPHRPLGAQSQPPSVQQARAPDQKVVEIDADADLARQWQQQAPPPKDKPKRLVERPRSKINTLRDECKRLGIPMVRKDNIETLTAKIEAHGKDTPEQRQ